MRLEVGGLEFRYVAKSPFLGPLDLSLGAGDMLGIVGPNGAGKSTLLRLLAGLIRPAAGEVMVEGASVRGMGAMERARRIAFVPQRSELPADMMVRDIVLMGRYPHRAYRLFESAEDFESADEVMRATETISFADRRAGTLSVGEQQRVQVAAALAQSPDLLLLDEPTSALDPYHQLATFQLLAELCESRNLSAVVVTHDLNLAGQHADRILLLHEGQAVAVGSAESVLTEDRLRAVYGVVFRRVTTESPERSWVLPAAVG